MAATLFIAVAVLIMAALSMRVVNTNNQVTLNTQVKDCLEGAESAVAQAMAELDNNQDGHIGLGTWTQPAWGTFAAPDSLPRFDSPGVAPLTLPGKRAVRYMAYVNNWETDGIDNNGDGNVDGAEETGYRGIYGIARYDDTPNSQGDVRFIERRLEVIVRGVDINVWRNAIFAGNGQAGGLINGNVSIHGSVHLLGVNLLEGIQAIAALDLSGASLIHNNYTGLGADIRARVPALPRTIYNGEDIETLNANLRVRNGLVELSGNSEIGEPDIRGNTTKETMDGTYVTDGWGGNATINDGDRGDPTSVFSDNGWDELYDLGTRVPMPMLADAWRDPGTGALRTNPATGQNYTHMDYFHSELTGTPYPGNLTIQANANFYYNATRPADANPANRQATDDYIFFNAATNVMQINGQIEVDGDLEITRGGGNDKTIHYTGRGALLVRGNAILNTDLYAQNANGTTALSYPVNNCFGIMVEGDMTIGTLSQLTLMGAFYAQGRIICSKQSLIMGTFVSNYFDMGGQVPDIYQVPDLATNLPLGMIGAYPILMIQRVSWREIAA
ncbi:MAG: hypothetical protein RBU21_03850 [FCB group bacterium]|nr:hypothetical protein [FCB group bacterium]